MARSKVLGENRYFTASAADPCVHGQFNMHSPSCMQNCHQALWINQVYVLVAPQKQLFFLLDG
jgi:hypothetical protein